MSATEDLKLVIQEVENDLKTSGSRSSMMVLTHIRNELYRLLLEPGAQLNPDLFAIVTDSAPDYHTPSLEAFFHWASHYSSQEKTNQETSKQSSTAENVLRTSELIDLAEDTKHSELLRNKPFNDAIPVIEQVIEEIRRVDADSQLKFDSQLERHFVYSLPLALPLMHEFSRWQHARRMRKAPYQ